MLRQRNCEQRSNNSITQTHLSTDVSLTFFFFFVTTYSALMVSMAMAHAAVSQASRALPVTSAQI